MDDAFGVLATTSIGLIVFFGIIAIAFRTETQRQEGLRAGRHYADHATGSGQCARE